MAWLIAGAGAHVLGSRVGLRPPPRPWLAAAPAALQEPSFLVDLRVPEPVRIHPTAMAVGRSISCEGWTAGIRALFVSDLHP
jgi:hypothetical protein